MYGMWQFCLLLQQTFMTLHEYASSFYVCFVMQYEIGLEVNKTEAKLTSVDAVYNLEILNCRLLS